MKSWSPLLLGFCTLVTANVTWANVSEVDMSEADMSKTSMSNTTGDNGLIQVKSQHSVQATTDKLVSTLKAKGMTVFNRIDHAQSAKNVGITLRPTQLVIFGNPKVGSP